MPRPDRPGALTVEFAGERHVADTRLSFGRHGDLVIDSNPHLHRLLGEFERRDGAWWLTNVGSRLFLTVVDADGSRTELAPGASRVLPPGAGTVRVAAGTARYQLDFRAPDPSVPAPRLEQPAGDGHTVEFDAILTPREVDFLITFAEPLLTGEHDQIPTYSEVAERWGVSPKTLDNTVQAVKRKMRNARLATDEPLDSLVRIAIAHSLIGPADLEWAALDDASPRSAANGPRFRFD